MITARANSNIAFIKYWGNLDDNLRIPANPSISMNLDGIHTTTSVRWDDRLASDKLVLNQTETTGQALERVSQHLDIIRQRAGIHTYAEVISSNNFPMGAGIASSASSFAALTVAAATAAGLTLSERELTTIARLGSGSASRSIPTGFVQWHQGTDHESSYAESITEPDHWDLRDVIAVVSHAHKEVGSRQGHTTANTSDLQAARVAGATKRLEVVKQAILNRDFATFADVVEYDSNLMHAVMMTSRPPLFYWQPATLTVMEKVRQWRQDGLEVCYTLDAGPNIHCICTAQAASTVAAELRQLDDVQDILIAKPGTGVLIIS
ncbi:MAG: diphosphomevalonate decarboxylase [Chloroflexi bacterium]|nr:MAG: diphosphomevalonate decarboxylase [Chloroflexota bacterium]